MIKLVYVIRRLPDMTAVDFYKRWLDGHAPLVKEVADDIRAVKYIQSHTMDTAVNQRLADSRGMAPAYDGITEVWWNSMDDLLAGMSSPEGKVAMERLLEDEKDFIDFEKSYLFITREHVIFDKS